MRSASEQGWRQPSAVPAMVGPGMKERIYIILVNWNGHRDTVECLESLARLQERELRVVVVDNGSTDGTIEAIQSWARAEPLPMAGPVWDRLPRSRTLRVRLNVVPPGAGPETELEHTAGELQVTLIEAGANLGFAAANNLGMRFAARDPNAAYFWLLNNDTVVMPDALSTLLAYAQAHPSKGIIGSVLLYYNQPDTIQGLGGWVLPSRALAGHIGSGTLAKCLPDAGWLDAELAYVIGASMFVRRAVFARTGGMSESYFLFYEELDWVKRLPPEFGIATCLQSVIYHKEGQSIGTNSRGRPSDTCLYYSYAGAIRFYLQHERRYAPIAIARILWNLIDFGRKRDMGGFRVTATVFADLIAGRRRRGPFGSVEFRSCPARLSLTRLLRRSPA